MNNFERRVDKSIDVLQSFTRVVNPLKPPFSFNERGCIIFNTLLKKNTDSDIVKYIKSQYGKHNIHHDDGIRKIYNTRIVQGRIKNKIIDVDIDVRLKTILDDKIMVSNMIRYNLHTFNS